MEEKKQRTSLQNRALHKYFELLAENLNDAGLDMRKVLKPAVDIPWSGETIKNYIWRPIQEAQLGKKSTTELKTDEINLVWETINRHLSEKFGISEPFPSVEEIMFRMREEEDRVKLEKKLKVAEEERQVSRFQ